jgi:hypothetical protein
MRDWLVIATCALLLSACTPDNGRPVADDRLLSTLSPDERSTWCQWRDDVLSDVVGADGIVTCTDVMSWPAGTVAECVANDAQFVACEAGLAAACIDALALEPCGASQPAGCADLDACVAALPPANSVACSANMCSCEAGADVSVAVELQRFGDVDYCVPSGDQLVCDGEYPTGCW